MHRLLRLVRGPGRTLARVAAPDPGLGVVGEGAHVAAHVAAIDAAPTDDHADAMGDGVPDAVLARARAAGAPPEAVAALAGVWAELGPTDRRGVARPLGDGRPGPLALGGAPARQTDGTTCGSAVLTMLSAAGDPAVALWLATGRLLPGHLPPEVRALPAAVVTSPDAAMRFSGLQRALKRASTRRALGPLPWPAALGTPPWGAARTARYPGVGWTHVLVDDTDPALVDAVLERADTALAAGIPVPLFTGGDLDRGPAAAVPRHVVLLVPGDARPRRPRVGQTSGAPAAGGHPGYAVYEPSRGAVLRVTRDELVRPGGPHPALGGWSHVCWAVLPRTDRAPGSTRNV